MRRRKHSWSVLVLTCCAALLSPSLAHAAFPGKNGKIAFKSERERGGQVWTVEPDGSGLVRLTDVPDYAGEPRWAPDGRHLAFISLNRATDFDVYRMRGDGTEILQLTTNPLDDLLPTWSPDKQAIAFVRFDEFTFSPDISTMTSLGGAETRITSGLEYDTAPAWSPAGDRIVFQRSGIGLFTVRPNGTGLTQLTGNATDGDPEWSPDGLRIAFHRHSGPGTFDYDVYAVDADGSGLARLTYSPGIDVDPAWSPDGSRIAFETARLDPSRDLWVMDADGTDERPLVTGPGVRDTDPDWQAVQNRAPGCDQVRAVPDELRRANRKLTPVALEGASDPDGDAVTLRIDGVTQDEPVRGPGDPTRPDARIDGGLELRAERAPRGDGRVYVVEFTVMDESGASCTGEAIVSVRRHRHEAPVDSRPPAFDSLR